MIKRFSFFFLPFIFCFSCTAAYAGAWVQDKGDGLDIFTFRYYTSKQFWTSSGHMENVPLYTKYELDNYLEYGLTQKLTVGMYSSALESYTNGNIHRGDNDNEFIGRYLLWQKNEKVLSAQLFADFLGPAVKFNVPPSDSRFNTGEALLFGTGGTLSKAEGAYWFFDTSAGFVQRFSAGNQLQINLEQGWKFRQEKLWFLLQSYNTLSLENTRLPQGVNYNLFTISPSVVYWLNNGVGVQLGVAQDVYGQNVGKGTSEFLAGWFKF